MNLISPVFLPEIKAATEHCVSQKSWKSSFSCLSFRVLFCHPSVFLIICGWVGASSFSQLWLLTFWEAKWPLTLPGEGRGGIHIRLSLPNTFEFYSRKTLEQIMRKISNKEPVESVRLWLRASSTRPHFRIMGTDSSSYKKWVVFLKQKIQILLSLLGIWFSCARFDGSELSDTLLLIQPLLFSLVGRNLSSAAAFLSCN